MNLIKSYEFFAPESCTQRINIIGCGSVGSTIAELLARFGLTKITLWDMDTVEAHNLVNQMFTHSDIGELKVEAVKKIITNINPDAEPDVKVKPNGWQGEKLAGYVFLCVDNIDLRRDIVKSQIGNGSIKVMFDCRTRLTDAQSYAARWNEPKEVQNLLNTMNFTHEEAVAETPVTACNVAMSVATTLRLICTLCVNNFIEYVRGGERSIKKMILADTAKFDIIAV